ncbi:hypothetical protein ABK040_015340 [Willaertia magna]
MFHNNELKIPLNSFQQTAILKTTTTTTSNSTTPTKTLKTVEEDEDSFHILSPTSKNAISKQQNLIQELEQLHANLLGFCCQNVEENQTSTNDSNNNNNQVDNSPLSSSSSSSSSDSSLDDIVEENLKEVIEGGEEELLEQMAEKVFPHHHHPCLSETSIRYYTTTDQYDIHLNSKEKEFLIKCQSAAKVLNELLSMLYRGGYKAKISDSNMITKEFLEENVREVMSRDFEPLKDVIATVNQFEQKRCAWGYERINNLKSILGDFFIE